VRGHGSLVVSLLLGASACATSRPPVEFQTPPLPRDAGCADVSGTYANEAARTQRPGRGVRHLAAFFNGIDDPAAVERVILSRPTPDVLMVAVVAPGALALRELLHRGTDFECDRGGYVFRGSDRVKRREGASIRLAPGRDGCLVERTNVPGATMFFLVLPIWFDASDEWNLFCPPGREEEP
jgi:hypothetical protein